MELRARVNRATLENFPLHLAAHDVEPAKIWIVTPMAGHAPVQLPSSQTGGGLTIAHCGWLSGLAGCSEPGQVVVCGVVVIADAVVSETVLGVPAEWAVRSHYQSSIIRGGTP